jgi:hypothetical protein
VVLRINETEIVMRTYRVVLTSEVVGKMEKSVLAVWYDDAQSKAEKWANESPEHGKYGPWVGSNTEVA